jgi:hypothetical protein
VRTVIEKNFTDYVGPGSTKDWDAPPDGRGPQLQGGNGGCWLCRRCNSFLGRSYVRHYSHFVRELTREKPAKDGTVQVRRVCLKRVLKQIIAMFCAINPGGPDWPGVVAFVRDPAVDTLPSGLRVFMFRCRGPYCRLVGFQGWADLKRPGGGVTMISEVAHPPMGFHLLDGHRVPHDPRMVEITDWTQYGLDDLYEIGLSLPVLPLFSPMFNDFRTPIEMRRDRQHNQSFATLKALGWWLPRS